VGVHTRLRFCALGLSSHLATVDTRLGHGNTSNQLKPKVVEAFVELANESLPVANIGGTRRCAAVSCGGTHTAVAMTNGELFVFGDGGDGQLGLGKASMGSVLWPQPVNVKTAQSVA